MKTIHRALIPAPTILSEPINIDSSIAVADVCRKAGYRYRVTGGYPPQVILHLSDNAVGWTSQGEKVYMVDVRGLDLNTQLGWEAVLEIIAYGFF